MDKYRVYKISSPLGDKCYIGSTVYTTNIRLNNHRHYYKKFNTGKYAHVSLYDLFTEYGIDNCKIETIEELQVKDRQTLLQRERWHIENTPTCVNKCVPARPKTEQYVCACGCKLTRNNLARHNKTKTHQAYMQNKN